MTAKKKLKLIDLFAGIGGIRQGFVRAAKDRISVVYSNDFDKHAVQTYAANFSEIDSRSILDVPVSEIPSFDILVGGFPCQAFSIAGKRQGFAETRGTLFFNVEKILEKHKPAAFLLENVGHLMHHNGGATFNTIHKVLTEKLKYDVHYKILNSKNFGVPQNRPRIYIVGFKKKTPFEFPKESKRVPLKSILEKPGSVDEKYYISQKYYEGLERHKKRHQDRGNGFGYMVLENDGVANTLVLGGMGRERNLVRDIPKNVYTKGKDKLKTKNALGLRKLTVKETLRLQGFEDDFIFPVSNTQALRQIANSVTVPVIEAIARQMLKYL